MSAGFGKTTRTAVFGGGAIKAQDKNGWTSGTSPSLTTTSSNSYPDITDSDDSSLRDEGGFKRIPEPANSNGLLIQTPKNVNVESRRTKLRSKSFRQKLGLTKSMSQRFSSQPKQQKTETVKDGGGKPGEARELSIAKSTPGVLKVFGDQISPGANYKSVLASNKSTAVELVKEILDRYSLSRTKFHSYALCDVIGKVSPKPDTSEEGWVEECVRVIGDGEKPLELQSFWKPAEGYSRRFEIRLRSEVATKEVDRITSDLNANMRRLQLSKSRSMRVIGRDTNVENQRHDSGEKYESVYTREDLSLFTELIPPVCTPYLITLQGFNPKEDLLVYAFYREVTTIGSSDSTLSADARKDIALYAPDIQPTHCWVYHNADSSGKEETVSIQPLPAAEVTINGQRITSESILYPGDLVGLGAHYAFVFKNPAALLSTKLSSPDFVKFSTCPKCHSTVVSLTNHACNSSRLQNFRHNLNQHLVALASEYDKDEARFKIAYVFTRENEILDKIIDISDNGQEEGFTLAPAYLICMCVEYSAYNHGQERLRRLLLKISGQIQNAIWDKTKEIANKRSEDYKDVSKSMDAILPDIEGIIFWMCNALELFNYFQSQMGNYLMSAEEGLSASWRGSIATADEEFFSVLEEVVMYTFQQTVYYLTKTLYLALPTILDSNPFNDHEEFDTNTSILSVLKILQDTYDMTQKYNVHPQMVKQLFAYLFFFTNASLINMFMERGTSGFFKWSHGVQIRGNLDMIESWSQERGFYDEAVVFLKKLSTVANLLATPKVQLLQADWSSLRKDFPALNPAQIQHILSEYQLGEGKPRPRGWFPPPDEVEPALRTSDINENFHDHPPLVLPTSGFSLMLKKAMENQAMHEHIQGLLSCWPDLVLQTGDTKTDSGENSPECYHPATRDQLSPGTKKKLSPQVYHASAVHVGESESQQPIKQRPLAPPPPPRGTTLQKQQMTHSHHATASTGHSSDTNGGFGGDYVMLANDKTDGKKAPPAAQTNYNVTVARSKSFEENNASRDNKIKENNNKSLDDIFSIEMDKNEKGLGLGLIDGMFTPLEAPGIYVRTLMAGGAAENCGKLHIGDRILAVNGVSIIGSDYQSAMKAIRNSGGTKLRFLLARSSKAIAEKISSAN